MDEFTQPPLSAQRRKYWIIKSRSEILRKHTRTTPSFTADKENASYVLYALNFKATIVYLLQLKILKGWQTERDCSQHLQISNSMPITIVYA